MAIREEPLKSPYYCPKCKNYYYHMQAGAHFIACPDCDVDCSSERDQPEQNHE